MSGFPDIGATLDAVRPEVRSLSAYHLEIEPCRFKLDQNEMPWDLPRRIKEEIARRLLEQPFAHYPDFHGDALRRDLGAYHDWPWQGVLVGNGSNELLRATLETFAAPGSEVLGTLPTFTLYRPFALASGARLRTVGPAPDLRLPIAELAAEIERDPTRPVVLCSPNNPTGDAVAPEVLAREILDRLEAPLLLDNAYGEFTAHDYRPLLGRYPNLVIFRTFSKAWSLGGLRVGYLLARPELVAELIKLKLPYNLGRCGIEAGRAVLAEPAAMERRVRLLNGRREPWRAMLKRHGIPTLASETNFFLARCGGRAPAIHAGLAARGIRVRDVGGYPGLAGCLRFSVGSGPALRAVDEALTDMKLQETEMR
ncbi:MAG: histidinol-phosphate transaminase [Acidobacteriota bacterium]